MGPWTLLLPIAVCSHYPLGRPRGSAGDYGI